jgi:hypothetical protein
MVGPVLVTVDPARTAKFAAVPSGTGPVAALALDPTPMSEAMATISTKPGTSQNGLPEARVPTIFIRTDHSPAVAHRVGPGTCSGDNAPAIYHHDTAHSNQLDTHCYNMGHSGRSEEAPQVLSPGKMTDQ